MHHRIRAPAPTAASKSRQQASDGTPSVQTIALNGGGPPWARQLAGLDEGA
ncbi:MAG: hypothetical protein ACREX8_14430 [Gammaproteobacteria bacterium]